MPGVDEHPRPSAAESVTSGQRGIGLAGALLFGAMLNLTLIVAGLKELILDELGGTVTDASLFFSIEMVAYVLGAPLAGLLSDATGRRRPFVIVGFAGSALLYAAYTQVDSVGLLLGLRFVQGAFSVMAWSLVMTSILDRAVAGARGRAMGVMGASLILGVAAGAPIGGVISHTWGPRAPLAAAAALFVVLAVAAFGLSDAPKVVQRPAPAELLRALRSKPQLFFPYAFYFVDRFTIGLFIVLFPLFLADLGDANPAVRGRLLLAFLLPFALLQMPAGRLCDRIGARLPLVAGSLLYGVAMAAVAWTGLGSLWLLMITLGVLAAVMFPPTMILTAEIAGPETYGLAMAGFNVAGSIGFAIGPLVGAWAHSRGGFHLAFGLAGALELAIAVAFAGWLVVGRSRRAGAEKGARD
jgi:MFS family permease